MDCSRCVVSHVKPLQSVYPAAGYTDGPLRAAHRSLISFEKSSSIPVPARQLYRRPFPLTQVATLQAQGVGCVLRKSESESAAANAGMADFRDAIKLLNQASDAWPPPS